jgi:tRNA G46 methylase TrmB
MLAIKTDHAGYYQWVLGLFGITEPEGFRTARARLRDLPMDKDIPASSEPIKRRFAVTMNSADFWHDPVALNHTSPRLFTGQPTSFETRFINKHQPIYYFEARRT